VNVRYVSEWDNLQKALNDTDVPVDEYMEALTDMAEEIVNRLEAARVDMEKNKE